MPSIAASLAIGLLAGSALATPTPAKREAVTSLAVRQDAKITDTNLLEAALSSASADLASLASRGEAILNDVVPTATPTAISQLADEFKSINDTTGLGDILASGAKVLLNGLAGGDYQQIANAYLKESSTDNSNPRQPIRPVYPKASPNDAPYSLSEAALRKVIYIPPGFTYGRVQPVILLPGTGAVAGQNFGPNIGKLLMNGEIGDPVYVNIPRENLADIQLAAEYAAYAVNYISGISQGKNVSTISWSAGSLDGQWALKYWPSNRQHLSNAIRISPDHHGSELEPLLCIPGTDIPGCTPAIVQQAYNSTFIRTLRNNDGDSAYVPTTNIYTIFDEIVQPQSDPNASAFLKDARGVGVTNVELQSVCGAVAPGGSFNNNHEGVLYNALAYSLAIDALTHSGPGSLARVDTSAECAKFAADGLSLADVLATHALIPLAIGAILVYEPKNGQEAPIRAYAQKDIPA